MLKLFYAPGACSLAPHIVLEEIGGGHAFERVNLREGAQRSLAYLAINPKGRVPVLMTDRGALTENPAILAFLAQSFPAARLAPLDDPYLFAKMQAFTWPSPTPSALNAMRTERRPPRRCGPRPLGRWPTRSG
jgi:glutathione S-transferase